MIFSEIYGTYYHVLSKILAKAVEGTLTQPMMYELIEKYGFGETSITIPQNLDDQTWPLLLSDLTTPLHHSPTQPLTHLQKRWLKTLMADPRIQLFQVPMTGLEDVLPLYPPEALVYFDRYGDGDPFTDPQYIAHFQTILTALRQEKGLSITFTGGKQTVQHWLCVPHKLEYSSKDDKFRLLCGKGRQIQFVNLARITDCSLADPMPQEAQAPPALETRTLLLELTDQRNAFERCMHHFSYLEKETIHLEDHRYRVILHYHPDEEAELLIRVLSFGPMLRVIAPDHFRAELRKRILRQFSMTPPPNTEE